MQVNVPYRIETESHDTRVEINVSCLLHVSVSGNAEKSLILQQHPIIYVDEKGM